METHHQFAVSVNSAPMKGEMSVLFSGRGKPVGGHYIGPAVHDHYLIHVVLAGEGVFETLGESYVCKAGDVFIIFPDILVRYEADKVNPWQYMWVAFTGDIADASLSAIGITPDRAVIRDCSLQAMKKLFRSVRSSIERESFASLGNMEASGWLRLILHEIASKGEGAAEHSESAAGQSRSYRQVDQAIRLLTLQYGQPLSIESLAHQLGYHRAHLNKLFKEATGLSPMQYLFKVRMKKAEELLGGDLTIAQIASSVGYNDPLFFTKQFRKWSGRTPTDYRRGIEADRRP
ncbi:AraC family transcriptional regulator [Paenibacillus sp. 2TAB19]|uniref:AraC family transcriptional regulator n=1 Tax=Paenibacillus sp. 2TAB19 TaxID=3233003 RepID=UPI003F9BF32A